MNQQSSIIKRPSVMTETDAKSPSRAEARSIDYIPESERHGREWHLGPMFFMANIVLTTLAVGVIGVSTGGNLVWSLFAIAAGIAVGTLFSALHASQGPRLGLPQMIQSRPQFGYVGVVIPLAMSVFLCIGLNIFNLSLGGSALQDAISVPLVPATIVIAIFAGILATFGYVAIHKIARLYSYVCMVVFTIFSVGALSVINLSSAHWDLQNFNATAFFVQFAAVASYQISFAPYVSDYSRYLPVSSSIRRSVRWTFLGLALGAGWFMSLGAVLLTAFPDAGAVGAIRLTADAIMPGFGVIILLISAVGLISVGAINMYSGSLNLLTMISSFTKVRINRLKRVASGLVIGLAGTLLAISATSSFVEAFNLFLTVILYFMAPWSAINLVDYFVIRKGHYSINGILNRGASCPDWNLRGLGAYFGAVVVMIPFVNLPFFTGWVSENLGGADIAALVGLPVSAVIYYMAARRETGSVAL